MTSPVSLKRKADQLLVSDVNKKSKHSKKAAVPLEDITIRLMQADEINAVLQGGLEGRLEFCRSDQQRKATRAYHNNQKERIFKKMQKDCDEGFKQYNRRVFVAVSKTKVLGSIGIKPRARKPLKDRSGVELYNVQVLPEYRGTGVAQRLLKEAENYCKKQKIGAIFLTTQDNLTRAIKFYEKEGYLFTHKKQWDSYQLYYYKKDLK